MKLKLWMFFFILLCADLSTSAQALSQERKDSLSTLPADTLTLVHTVMCEKIKGYIPLNQAIVFPISIKKVSCFTSFDPVPEKTFIYHKWFHRDTLATKKKLALKPPCWSTFSSIKLREADKGPWRVEITDSKGNIFHITRFSITD